MRACLQCNEPFTGSRSTARFCSDACRARAHRSQRVIPAAPVRQDRTGAAGSLDRAERALLRGTPLRRLGLDNHEQAALVVASKRFESEERFAAAALLARERLLWARGSGDMLDVELALIDALQHSWVRCDVLPGRAGRPRRGSWCPARAPWVSLWEYVEWHVRRNLVRVREDDAMNHRGTVAADVGVHDSYFGEEPDSPAVVAYSTDKENDAEPVPLPRRRRAGTFRHPQQALRGASAVSSDTLSRGDLKAIRKQIHETGYARRWETPEWPKPGHAISTPKGSFELSGDWSESKRSSLPPIQATKQ